MLLVPVKVNRSLIHGIGIFASQVIEANTRIWSFTPGFDLELDPSALQQQPDHFRETMLHYGYIDPRRRRGSVDRIDTRFEPIGPTFRHASIDFTTYSYLPNGDGVATAGQHPVPTRHGAGLTRQGRLFWRCPEAGWPSGPTVSSSPDPAGHPAEMPLAAAGCQGEVRRRP
jgi:hypothetical protein